MPLHSYVMQGFGAKLFILGLNRPCEWLQQVGDMPLHLQRHCDAAELDPLAHSTGEGEAPLLLTSASPQRLPQQRLSKAASARSSLTTTPMLLSGSGTGMMTVVKTQFVPLGDSLSDSDSDSEVTNTSTTEILQGASLSNQSYLNVSVVYLFSTFRKITIKLLSVYLQAVEPIRCASASNATVSFGLPACQTCRTQVLWSCRMSDLNKSMASSEVVGASLAWLPVKEVNQTCHCACIFTEQHTPLQQGHASLWTSESAESNRSFLPDMSLDSRLYLHMHGVWQPTASTSSGLEDTA